MKFKNIHADKITIGQNVFIDESAFIRGVNGNAKNIIIGDNTYIGAEVQIICDDFEIGDYCKIHHHTNIHGYKKCQIGHNAWIGQYTIIDSIGGTTIGDNCGIGAHSQLWSHIKFGDTLEGCRFDSEKPMIIGNDVWFVGHCIVAPIVAEDKSMALVGSVIIENMKSNHIYGGSPAKVLTDSIGYQFEDVNIEEKNKVLQKHLENFKLSTSYSDDIQIVRSKDEILNNEISYFVVEDRKYNKTLSENEIRFMKYLLPEKAKFTPY